MAMKKCRLCNTARVSVLGFLRIVLQAVQRCVLLSERCMMNPVACKRNAAGVIGVGNDQW